MAKLVSYIKRRLKVFLFVSDIAVLFFSVVLAYLIKMESFTGLFGINVPEYLYFLLADIIATTVCFFFFHIYDRMWQYPVLSDYGDLFIGFLISKLLSNILMFRYWSREFLTWLLLYLVLSGVGIITMRVALRWFYNFWQTQKEKKSSVKPTGKIRVMLIGAGDAGRAILAEFGGSRYHYTHTVVAIIDDKKSLKGKYMSGVKIYGGRNEIVRIAAELEVDEIYLAMPSADAKTVKDILDICKHTDCKLKRLPGMFQFINGQLTATQLKDVEYIDLLGRDPIHVDLTEAFEGLKGKNVLITGGGGSIGSELCRQIAASGVVDKLIIFDIAENGAYDIQQELKRRYPKVNVAVLIGSVRDENRLDEIFAEYAPHIVYHAAAHKHVPLMETSPKEAVKNNIFGTLNLAQVADKYGVERFVMISTDKAVNPTNVMGATKRVCEMIVQTFNKTSSTDFVAVRFGNVLGSNGSVIPLFKEQIASGGPVTVTDPDIIRFFMLIPEAVALVLKAGASAKGGEIFVLDMGTPVKIAELAENMIKLSGYKPGIDIEIRFTGLREGEKLYEELLIDEEGIEKTADELIYVAKPTEIYEEELFEKLSDLENNLDHFTKYDIIDKVKGIVTTYKANNSEYNEKKRAAANLTEEPVTNVSGY